MKATFPTWMILVDMWGWCSVLVRLQIPAIPSRFVRLGSCGELWLCWGAHEQGTVLAPSLFTLYTADFMYNSETRLLQKYSHDTVVVVCFRDRVQIAGKLRNAAKTKEVVVDFRRTGSKSQPLGGGELQYLAVHLDHHLDWTRNTEALYKKGQSGLYFLKRLRFFSACRRCSPCFTDLWWRLLGGSIEEKDKRRLGELVRKVSAVVGLRLDSYLLRKEGSVGRQDRPLHHVSAGEQRSARSSAAPDSFRSSLVSSFLTFLPSHFDLPCSYCLILLLFFVCTTLCIFIYLAIYLFIYSFFNCSCAF